MKLLTIIIMLCMSIMMNNTATAQQLDVSLELPAIATTPYHRPYVAVWIETPKRQGIHTLVFWKEQTDWFKDLRQWWRKIGRNNTPNYDAVSGATRKPGTYNISWNGLLTSQKTLPAGDYVLHIEAVREQGSREYLRQKITWGSNTPQHYTLQGKTELGSINIAIK